MPSVNGNEVPANLPTTLNGRDLKKALNMPENRILTRVKENGTEEVVRNDDTVTLQPGDRFDSATTFSRG